MFRTLNNPAADASAPFVSWYDVSRHADRDRRAHDRLVAHELEWLKSARLRCGSPLSLIDLSPGGALFETTTPLGPGSTATLTLTGEGITETATFRLLRCEVASLKHGLVFRGACVFDRILQLPTVPIIGKDRASATPAEPPASTALGEEQILALVQSVARRTPGLKLGANLGTIIEETRVALARGDSPQMILRLIETQLGVAAGNIAGLETPRGARFEPARLASSQPNLDPRTGPGWNRIVVRYLDGRMLKGFSQDFHAGRATFHVSAATSALDVKPVLVPMAQLKAIFFVRDFEGNPGRVDGQAFVPKPAGTAHRGDVPGRRSAARFDAGLQARRLGILRHAGRQRRQQPSRLRAARRDPPRAVSVTRAPCHVRRAVRRPAPVAHGTWHVESPVFSAPSRTAAR